MFFDDRLAMPGIYGGSVAEAVRTRRPAGEARPEHRARRRRRRHPAHRARRHLLDDLLLAVPRRPHLRHARPPVRRPGRLERRHVGERQRGPELRRRRRSSATTSATTGPTSSSRRRPGCGTPGRTTPSSSTGRAAIFADPDKVHELNYEGEWFNVRGPLTVPRSPQGRPVLLQAGSSGRGRDFAARWAELIFTGDPDIDIARSHYKDQKERIAEAGRDPDVGEDAADGLHGGRRVARPTPRSASSCS